MELLTVECIGDKIAAQAISTRRQSMRRIAGGRVGSIVTTALPKGYNNEWQLSASGGLIMRRTLLLALASVVSFLGQSVLGQAPNLLGQLEQRLQGTAPSGAAAPGSGYLGAIVDDDGEQGRGVRVISAKPGAPAATSGLKDGDLIVSVDGKAVTGLAQLDAVLDRAIPNQKLQMAVERGGSRQQVTVTLGTRPAAPGPGEQNPAEA